MAGGVAAIYWRLRRLLVAVNNLHLRAHHAAPCRQHLHLFILLAFSRRLCLAALSPVARYLCCECWGSEMVRPTVLTKARNQQKKVKTLPASSCASCLERAKRFKTQQAKLVFQLRSKEDETTRLLTTKKAHSEFLESQARNRKTSCRTRMRAHLDTAERTGDHTQICEAVHVVRMVRNFVDKTELEAKEAAEEYNKVVRDLSIIRQRLKNAQKIIGVLKKYIAKREEV
ncbi:uncharacterized protein J3D65DRAFT_685042 [Phyllosticta citribraziliensis]|uniref:Uncharacterized protein n=1 Tax=Phyllosticta citribraziliensis TaxID=989973 RepID=A0ABR1LDQ9_9PEZI